MAKSAPAPRPALTKAPDAGVHPVSGRATTETPTIRSTSFRPQRRGATTADAVIQPEESKLVDLSVQIPKPVRKKLKALAKERGVSVDDLVAAILSGSLPR